MLILSFMGTFLKEQKKQQQKLVTVTGSFEVSEFFVVYKSLFHKYFADERSEYVHPLGI